MPSPADKVQITACRSIGERITLDDVEIIGGPNGITRLLAREGDAAEKRRELISSVRGGKHVELALSAITYRQRAGSPNKNFMRIKDSHLGVMAATYKNMPMLVDHRSWLQAARIGTILESERADLPHDWAGFRQKLHVVKPDAVMSVLDGTLDRFSVAWRATGSVMCSVHKVDLLGPKSCRCWPGDHVDLDGQKQIVEYEFQSADGTEVSGVNDPAVSGTKIEDIRAALAVELSLPTRKDMPMNFARLAAILGLAALSSSTDEDAAVKATEDLKRGKLAAEQERDTARTELATVKAELETAKKAAKEAKAASLATQIDTTIAKAYTEGKLRWGRDDEGKAIPSKREDRLRRIAKEDGLAALEAELDDMPVIVPLGRRQVGEADPVRERATGDEGVFGSALSSTAAQLGLDAAELEAFANNQTEG